MRRVAAGIGVDPRLDRRRRRGEDDGEAGEMAAHHRHVAGIVEDAVLLLVGEVVLLIDDDEAEIGEGQEQRRARADHDPDRAVGDAAPDPLAHPRRHLGMPLAGPRPEARREALEEPGGERDLRDEHQHLPALAERFGNRLEIDLGLARAGDAVEEGHRVAAGDRRFAEDLRRRGLLGVEHGRGVVDVGRPGHGRGGHRHFAERPRLDEPLRPRSCQRPPRRRGRTSTTPCRRRRARAHACAPASSGRARDRRGGRR